MKIAVLGTGIVGKSISVRLAGLGHHVTLGTRSVEETLARDAKDRYGNPPFGEWKKTHPEIGLKDFTDVAKDAEIVFNCTFGMASINALTACGAEHLNGKIIVDIANPLDFSHGMPPTLNPVNTDSLGEQIQNAFPGAKVVKTLNTMNAAVMVDPTIVKGDHNVFMSGNDAAAKEQTQTLLQSFGWKPAQIIDLGDITSSRGAEMVLPIWLRLLGNIGHGRI